MRIIAILKDAGIPCFSHRRLRADVLQVRSEVECEKRILKSHL